MDLYTTHLRERGLFSYVSFSYRLAEDLRAIRLAHRRALNRVFTLIFVVPAADRAQLCRAQSNLHFGSLASCIRSSRPFLKEFVKRERSPLG
jgi:hypothetical protein